MKDVYFEYGSLASIIISCLEVYDKEAEGILGCDFKRNRIIIKASCPIQTAIRKKGQVARNEKGYERARNALGCLVNNNIIGHYHSHPKSLAIPSDHDLEACISDLKEMKKLELIPTDEILEVIIGVRKKKYKKSGQTKIFEHELGEYIEGRLRLEKVGYDLAIYGYWISSEELMIGDYANIKKAKLFIDKKSYPSYVRFE